MQEMQLKTYCYLHEIRWSLSLQLSTDIDLAITVEILKSVEQCQK